MNRSVNKGVGVDTCELMLFVSPQEPTAWLCVSPALECLAPSSMHVQPRSITPRVHAIFPQSIRQLWCKLCHSWPGATGAAGADRDPAPARIGRHRSEGSVTIFKGQLLMKQAHLLGLAVRPNNLLAMRPINPPHMSPIEYVAAAASDQLGAGTGVEV